MLLVDMIHHNPAPDVSIVVVTWNAQGFLRECLESVISTAGSLAIEIILVDNASSDATLLEAYRLCSEIQVKVNASNLGFACAVNQGIQLSSGRYIFLLNPDTIIQAGTLNTLCVSMDSNPELAAAGPIILDLDGSVQTCGERFKGLFEIFLLQTLGVHLHPPNNSRSLYKVDWVTGAAMMLRKKTLKEIGLFDEGYWMYAEDMDWCWRANQHGWSVAIVPSGRIIHHHSRSAQQNFTSATLANATSLIRWLNKYRGNRLAQVGKIIIMLGLLERAIANLPHGGFKTRIYFQVAQQVLQIKV